MAEQTSSSNPTILRWTKGKPLCDQIVRVSNTTMHAKVSAQVYIPTKKLLPSRNKDPNSRAPTLNIPVDMLLLRVYKPRKTHL